MVELLPFFRVYAVGLVHASVCTNLSDEEATERLNQAFPTGVSPWAISADVAFATGQPNPCPCPDSPDRRHLLYSC